MVDQGNGDIYVAIVSLNSGTGAPGEIARYDSGLSANGTFAVGGGLYTGIARDPVSGGLFAAQMEIPTPFGNFGTPRLDKLTSSGGSAGSFPLAFTDSLPQIITDSSGRIYYPNVNTHSVQVLSSSGTVLEEITCSGCPGGVFGKPAAVALNASGALYVADAGPDRVVKLTLSGGHYAYDSLVQSGRGAGAVAVDPGNGDILVGDFPDGRHYHVVAYHSSGVQFDDFGAGLAPDSTTGYGALSAYQLAVNGSTHRVYLGGYQTLYAFKQATIPAPTATAEAATRIGQRRATMNALVNAHGHAVLECEFEYTDEADFLANGFSNASTFACPTDPDGTGEVPLGPKVSGLSPDTAYLYRLTATSNGGSVTSDEESFETLPEAPPVVTPKPATKVTQTTARIEAAVNPRGGEVSDCHFELGTSTAYGTDLPCPSFLEPVDAETNEAQGLTGLSPATTYHYRLVLTTDAGSAESGDVAFTTAEQPDGPEFDEGTQPGDGGTPPAVAPSPSQPSPVIPRPVFRCKKGFRRERVHGHARCVKVCPRGFRSGRVHGKVKCVPRRQRSKDRRRQRAHASG